MRKLIRLGILLCIAAPLVIDRLPRSAVWEPGDALSSIVGVVSLIALLGLYLLDKSALEQLAEFETGYAKRSGVTVEWLHAQDQRGIPCDCGEEGCRGWQMVHLVLEEQDNGKRSE